MTEFIFLPYRDDVEKVIKESAAVNEPIEFDLVAVEYGRDLRGGKTCYWLDAACRYNRDGKSHLVRCWVDGEQTMESLVSAAQDLGYALQGYAVGRRERLTA